MRTVCVVIWTLIISVVCSVMTILVSYLSKNDDTLHKIVKIWANSILATSGVKVTLRGLSHIKKSQSHVYMSNHQSNFDIPVLISSLPVHFRWLAKTDLFKIPLFGFAMKRASHISIDRSNRRSAFKSLKRAADIIRSGVSVLIFPEGTRSEDGSIEQFKQGGFVLAIDSGMPIVPVIINGTFPIMPRDQPVIKRGNVTLTICKPIQTTDYNRKTKDKLSEKIKSIICESFEKEKKAY